MGLKSRCQQRDSPADGMPSTSSSCGGGRSQAGPGGCCSLPGVSPARIRRSVAAGGGKGDGAAAVRRLEKEQLGWPEKQAAAAHRLELPRGSGLGGLLQPAAASAWE